MIQLQHSLSAVPFNPEFGPAARNAVTQCLRIQPDEKVTRITDFAAIRTQVRQLASAAREIRAPNPAGTISLAASHRHTNGSRRAASSVRTSGATFPAARRSPLRYAWMEHL